MHEEASKPTRFFVARALVTAFVSIFAAVLMTAPGQSLDLPRGKLQMVPVQNGVFWMVWSHWFPDTEGYS